jgi:hypothetical protein
MVNPPGTGQLAGRHSLDFGDPGVLCGRAPGGRPVPVHRPTLEKLGGPTEADGGTDLLSELMRRGLFDAGLPIRAAQAVSGLFCWPPASDPAERTLQPPLGEGHHWPHLVRA